MPVGGYCFFILTGSTCPRSTTGPSLIYSAAMLTKSSFFVSSVTVDLLMHLYNDVCYEEFMKVHIKTFSWEN